MELVMSKKVVGFFELIEKFTEGAEESDDLVISIELHIVGTEKTLKWELTEQAYLIKNAVSLIQNSSEEKGGL